MRSRAITGPDSRQWNGEPLVLFVEGYSDLCFYAELMQSLGKHEQCFIQNLGGKGRTNLEKQASLLLVPDKLEQMEAVGVILDADESAKAAFALAQRSLRNVIRVEVPAQSVWITAGRTKYGVFIAGDPYSGTGEIETLAWLSWAGRPENARLRECVSSYLQCARGAGQPIHSWDKARVNSLLAVLHDEDPRLGPAARANLFDLHAAELAGLREFLRQM